MGKRIISFVLALIMCLSAFSVEVYAKENKAYQAYQDAIQVITSSGSWTEDLTMTADMSISKGSAKTKTKATITSNMDVSNYSVSDLSNIKMSGSADMSVMGQKYTWNIQYENGIAHYEYTEPNQTTADIEMDPSCFDFNSLTADMMEKAKVSGNKITFTIPGNKMEEAGIAAVNMMSGIEDLDYDDVDVEILIDKQTGAVEKMTMAFHASLTYQGYDAEVDYQIDYVFIRSGNNTVTEPVEDDIIEMEIDDGLIIYSDYQNLSIRKDSIITLSAGIIIGGKQVEDVSGITFWTDDSSILEISDTGIKDNRRYVKFKGIDIGTTYVYFNDSYTNYTAKVPVTVYEDNYLSYTLNSVPTQYIEKYPTNIYNANGLYVDNYSYSVNDNGTAEVSFDVYNTNYTYGVVEVYSENGTLKDAVLIKKMSSNNTSIKKALWDNTGCLIRDMIDGDFLSYRQESGFSKKTSVSIEIPQNGYIKICNDPQNSAIVNIINSVDVLMSLGKIADKVKNYDVNAEVFSEELTLKLVKEKAFATLVKDGSKLQEDLWKGVAKEAAFSTDSLGNFCNTMAKNLSDFDLGKLIANTAEDFGWSVGEEVFKYFTGPIKMVFDGLFAFGKLENIIIQHTDLIQSSNVGSIYIQNQGGGVRSSQQITVESDAGFTDDTSLNVFKVTLDSTMLDVLEKVNPEVYEKIANGTSYTYNISLMKNGVETQPDGEVTVYIPIPGDLKFLAYVYIPTR
ncbi:MAG: hypothetical protein MSA26_08305 [Lachnospiraceae bacterium]|nr:hypothetical protein [Lachnospiraceae bacterium]